MSTGETTPTNVEETTDVAEQTANPQGSESAANAESSHAQSAESQEAVTLEQLQQQNAEFQQKISDLNKGFTESSQENSRLRTLTEQYQGALGQFVDRQRQQTDPRLAAEAEYREARTNYDPDAELLAMNKIRALDRQDMIAESVRLNQAANQAAAVKDKYGYEVNDLAQFHANMSPELIAKAKLISEGKYEDVATKDREAAHRRSLEAAAVGRLVGDGSTGTVPGGFDTGPTKSINDITFMLLPQSKQSELVADGYRVIRPNGEDITPSS